MLSNLRASKGQFPAFPEDSSRFKAKPRKTNMNTSHRKTILSFCMAAMAVYGGFETKAIGGLPTASGWIITGPAPAGRDSFLGNGNVAALSTSTNPALSAGGGDLITLNAGGFAIGSGVNTIVISTS